MHLGDLPEILAIPDDFMVELKVGSNGSELWSRDLSQWVQVQVVKAGREEVDNSRCCENPSNMADGDVEQALDPILVNHLLKLKSLIDL